jgi:hypothetical protein
MIDPATFRQLTEIRYQERLEQYARPRPHHAAQKTPQITVSRQVQGAWTALLARLSLATGR